MTSPTFIADQVDSISRAEHERMVALMQDQITALKRRVEWFERQLFGQTSEKRPVEPNPHQPSLMEGLPPFTPAEAEKVTVTYQRGKGTKQRPDDCVNDTGLRFNADVPVEMIELSAPEQEGPEADQFEVIGTKSTFRLAQRPASYVVLHYKRPVLKRKGTEQPLPSPAPANVLDRSLADVSLLVGLLVDKFQYHLPLYRQHQRITQAGITLSRATLTQLVKRSIELLRPIVAAQLENILRSRVLAMDETPIKAGKAGKGKLKQAWFWPLYGDADEVVFTYSASRGRQHIEQVLRQSFQGTLISDGYAAYARYAQQNEGVTHAQCWVHSRRQFIEAESQEPVAVREALDFIAALYRIEEQIREQWLSGERKHQYRLERTLRPIPMGRKAWLFCWTELGAEHVGIIQSLICTCKLHGINPYTYLTDVLLRVNTQPASKVHELTPREWKNRFADIPLRSDLYQVEGRESDCNPSNGRQHHAY